MFSRRFLVERPLLAVLQAGERAVLLIDEVDRADDEFEAFLLEFLSDFQVTIPEIGRIGAEVPPIVVLTSNRTRELHDAVKRRYLYHWIDFPDVEREVQIIRTRAPEVPAGSRKRLPSRSSASGTSTSSSRPGLPRPSTGRALAFLGGDGALDPQAAVDTLGSLVKHHDDLGRVRDALATILDQG